MDQGVDTDRKPKTFYLRDLLTVPGDRLHIDELDSEWWHLTYNRCACGDDDGLRRDGTSNRIYDRWWCDGCGDLAPW